MSRQGSRQNQGRGPEVNLTGNPEGCLGWQFLSIYLSIPISPQIASTRIVGQHQSAGRSFDVKALCFGGRPGAGHHVKVLVPVASGLPWQCPSGCLPGCLGLPLPGFPSRAKGVLWACAARKGSNLQEYVSSIGFCKKLRFLWVRAKSVLWSCLARKGSNKQN